MEPVTAASISIPPILQPTTVLRSLMQQANIPSYRALATQAQVSRWQVQQLRTGHGAQLRVGVMGQLADALNISVSELLRQFGLAQPASESASASSDSVAASAVAQLALLKQECQRLQSQLNQQEALVRSRVQTEALQTLESWLMQWPTIAKRAQEKGDALPAAKILPFLRPIEQLITDWGVEAIAPVDAQVSYDPQLHQITGATVSPGDTVQVTYSGHRHQGKLLHRAKVKSLPTG